jgi:PA domain-containing protein
MSMTTRTNHELWVLWLAAIAACSESTMAPVTGPNDAKVAPAPVLSGVVGTPGDLMVSSSALATPAPAKDGAFGLAVFGLPGRRLSGMVASAGLGCVAADFAGFPTGSIALVQRGTCLFSQKASNALAAGAIGMMVYQNAISGDALVGMAGDPVGIPAVLIGRTAGLTLLGAAPVGVTVEWNPFDPLAALVTRLQAAGVLNQGVVNSLITKLGHAKGNASTSEDGVAVNQLAAFVNEVEALVKSKRVAEVDGRLLIVAANTAISTLAP